jgi:hypothetical protein
MDHQHDPAAARRPRRRTPAASRSPRTRSVVIATGMLALAITPFAVAATGSPLREGVRNGTTRQETQIISNIASTTRTTGGYSTRQSNLSTSGGGAVYGCRSAAGGSAATPTAQNPCIRANNLSTGYAFEFNASDGAVVGLISAGAGGDAKKPFVTNATGVATGLNADRVDGLDASAIVAAARVKAGLDADTLDGKDLTDVQARFAQVTIAGDAVQTRGVPTGGVGNPAGAGTYDVVFNGDLTNCALSATITGEDAGQITATPTVAGNKQTTTVFVRTFDGNGTALNRPFHLVANC